MIHPIPQWRKAWRMLSVQSAALAVGFGLLPIEQQAAILAFAGVEPDRVPAIIGITVIVARLIDQPKTHDNGAS